MESIYYVLCWACHRKCRHCYEPRFRPYVRGALDSVVAEAAANSPRIIDHFPPRMTYLDLDDAAADGSLPERRGRIILSGGETLLDPVRTAVTYPAIERIRDRYAHNGGVNIVVQTTGDLVTDSIVDDLLARGVWMISVSGIDDYHVGLESADRQEAFKDGLTRTFEAHGLHPAEISTATDRKWFDSPGPYYSFFGATPDSWIGRLWPRGRAWQNNLSTATLADNFCNRWSGGLNFLRHRYSGSEVSVEPDGNVYPCCLKTKLPVGNLLEDDLISVLDSLAGEPAFEAISMGHPERMGLAHGWDEERFIAESHVSKPNGQPYANLCIGCDRFHETVLGPVIAAARERRAARKAVSA